MTGSLNDYALFDVIHRSEWIDKDCEYTMVIRYEGFDSDAVYFNMTRWVEIIPEPEEPDVSYGGGGIQLPRIRLPNIRPPIPVRTTLRVQRKEIFAVPWRVDKTHVKLVYYKIGDVGQLIEVPEPKMEEAKKPEFGFRPATEKREPAG